MPKILLISQEKVHAAVNGATKMLYYFANNMKARGYEVVVCYPAVECPDIDPNLAEGIKFYNLNYINMSNFKSKHKHMGIMEYILSWRCKKELEKLNVKDLSDRMEYVIQQENPDVIIPFFAHVTTQLLFNKKYDIPVLQMYHSHPKVYHAISPLFSKKSKPMAILFNHCVKKITGLQVFFPSYKELMEPFFKGRVRVIHNPVRIPNAQVNLAQPKKKIIYLSRIDKNKGQNLLIEAFATIAKIYSDWEVLLYGDFEPKEYRSVINSLITKHGLERQVKVMGVTNNPVEAFMNADIGAYTSIFEGFPLGLSEALACGLPCIGLKSATGINELILDRENGLLTENNQVDIARKLTELMNNTPLRIKYGQKARESVALYSEERFFAKWEAFIDDMIAEGKN